VEAHAISANDIYARRLRDIFTQNLHGVPLRSTSTQYSRAVLLRSTLTQYLHTKVWRYLLTPIRIAKSPIRTSRFYIIAKADTRSNVEAQQAQRLH
jgi:hypothetical protein